MKTKVYLIIFSLFLQPVLSISIAQSNSKKYEIKNKTYHNVKTGINYGWLKNNMGKKGLYNYELTLGYSANHFFLRKVNVQIQALWGIKIKKPYPYPSGYKENDWVEKTLSTNHFYFEFPISLGYMIIPRLEVRAGYSYRYYTFNSDYPSDFFDNNGESGIIAGFNFRLSEKASLGSTFFSSINDICTYHDLNQNIYNLQTRYLQIAFKYRLN
jgi:hypothetical protein